MLSPSVSPPVTLKDQSKMIEVRIMQPYSSHIPLVFAVMFHPEILMGSIERGHQARVRWGKQAIFQL